MISQSSEEGISSNPHKSTPNHYDSSINLPSQSTLPINPIHTNPNLNPFSILTCYDVVRRR